jgi:hypothetical protein
MTIHERGLPPCRPPPGDRSECPNCITPSLPSASFLISSSYYYFLFCSAAAPLGPTPSYLLGSYITNTHTHARTHAHPVGLLLTSDQLVTEAATCTIHNKTQNTKTMPSAGFEPAIPSGLGRSLRSHGHRDRPFVN